MHAVTVDAAKTRQRQGKARQGKARQGKARQGKARQGKARQGKARQGKEKANMLTSAPVDPAAGAGVVSLILSLILGCSGVEESISMNTSHCW
jgi:hypothetical protein